MLRVLITGAHGQVGHELMRLVPEGIEAVGFGSRELDISDVQRVDEVLEQVRPQLIINAAAYTAVDKAESDSEQAFAVNRDGVANLARAAERLSIPLLHISTDYVFAGDAQDAYREADTTGPSGVYGASKLAGEQALIQHCSRHVILRTSWVFGAHGNNFVKTMLRLGRERDSLAVVADQRGGPTAAPAIAKMLWRLVEQYRREGILPWGVYHYSGAPACSWCEFAEVIFQQAVAQGLLPRVPLVRAITTADYPTPARRPAWSVLDGSRLLNTFGIAQPDWRVDLHEVLCELASVV